MEFQFEDPGPSTRGKTSTVYDAARQFLKDNPNRWVVIREYKPDPKFRTPPTGRATSLKQSLVKTKTLGENVELVARKGKVYARLHAE